MLASAVLVSAGRGKYKLNPIHLEADVRKVIQGRINMKQTERPNIMIPRCTLYGKYWSVKDKSGNRVVNPNSRRVTENNVREAVFNMLSGGRVTNTIFNEDATY